MHAICSSEVRNGWSGVMDSVIRKRPAFIRRTRDFMMLSSIETISALVADVKYVADEFHEEDGSVTLSLRDMDIIANMIMEDGYKPKTDLENLIIMVLLLFESETEDSSSEFFPTYDFETMAINADGLKRFVYASGGWKEFDYYA